MNSTHDLVRSLARYTGAAPDKVAELRARLAATAESDGILDVAYRVAGSPVGDLLVAATQIGLVHIAYASENHDSVLQSLAERISPAILNARARLDPVARELEEYFDGQRRSFDVPIDWRLSAGFGSTVLHHLPEIGYGHTASYAAVAQLVGNPKAARAVGSACATNPLPVIVPCHRVVRANGGLGGYLGGVEAKRTLLTLEVAASRVRAVPT
jgi:methylated-DNA-[protein]-cysteine S-methyltransferase